MCVTTCGRFCPDDGAVAGYRIAADVYEVLLGIEAVSHYAAFEIGRGARHGRGAGGDGYARAGFRTEGRRVGKEGRSRWWEVH